MTRSASLASGPVCPIPLERYPVVTLAHGGGGRLMSQLIEEMFVRAFDSEGHGERHDAAVLPSPGARLAMTTDSFVVRPIFFPGGDIGHLGIYGTVNDLAMAGARPLWLSLGLILEEGLPMGDLWRVVRSLAGAAEEVGVRIVTGDTKVVDRGKGDGVYLNTTGIGVVETEATIAPSSVRPGDAVLVSGDLGRHGIAVMARREGLSFETEILSDCASLVEPVHALIDAGIDVHCLRDMTRGGLGAAVHEIAEASGTTFALDEPSVPVGEDVRGACEMLGLEALHVANEGRFLAVVPEGEAARAVQVLAARGDSAGPAIIGRVEERGVAPVVVRTQVGLERILDLPSGEQLPRIC